MLAAVYHNFQEPFSLEKVPDPQPGEKGVVLQVLASGICRSDWHGWMGHDPDIKLPHIPGHEMTGVVVACGNQVRKVSPGQRVTLPFVCGCGYCTYCKQGDQQVCDHQFQPGFTNWGSFAQYVAIDHADHNLVNLPEEINDITAAALGCRFATAFRALVDQGRLQPGQWVVIYGCGGVGLSALLIAKALHSRVIAVDINTNALNLAKELGADLCLQFHQEENPGEIREVTKGGANLSLDAFGGPHLVGTSLQCLRKRGKHIQVGLLSPKDRNVSLPMDMIIANEWELIGSHGMQAHRYGAMLELIMNSHIDLSQLVSKTITLGQSPDALVQLDTFARPGIMVISDFTQ